MSYIFMDESGDLGFDFQKRGTTDHFVITLLFAANKRPIEKCVRKVHAVSSKKPKGKRSILHAYHEKPATRIKLLSDLAKKDVSIVTIILNKRKVYARLQEQKTLLYNYVTNILLDRVFKKKLIPATYRIELIAERRETNKFFNANFKDYLERQITNNHKVNLMVEVKTSFEEKALQAVDFASWAIFRKYEIGDCSYYNLIKGIIIEESWLYP